METENTVYLSARLRPPRLARGVIARPRLDGLLELVRTRLLTVVKAPAGYGKTTVAQSWATALAGEGARVAWLSLSPQDDDAERFFGALAAALRRAGTGAGSGAAAAAGAGDEWAVRELSIPLRHRIAWLEAELAADPGELFIVLDDYQEITRPAIHEALSAQLQHAPERLHLILLTRSAPPIDLAPLRAHDAVLELDAQMLRFDLAETQALLRKSHGSPAAAATAPAPGQGLGPQDALLLLEMTGGWIAALRAALLSARIHGSAGPALRRLPATLRSINALFAELLDRVSAPLLDFMLRVSVAERLCAPLAARLSGRADAQAVLEQLERSQLFLSALDESQQWFAFHRLFRDALQRQAERRDPALLPAMRREAAAWCAEQGQWADAIGHALGAGDTVQALAWIEQHAMAVVGAGDLLTLLDWERQLRAHLVESPLRLRLAFAWALSLAMACDKALVLLDGVEAQLAQATEAEQAALRSECLALRAVVVCTLGDYELAGTLAQQVRSDLPQPPWVANALRNVDAAVCLHTGRWEQLYQSPPVQGEATGPAGAAGLQAGGVPAGGAGGPSGAPPGGDTTARVYRLAIRGLGELRQGHLDEAAALLGEGLRIGADSPPLAALPAPSLALVRYLQDNSAEAARLNAAHFDVNKRVAPIEGLYLAYLVAARLARLEGQPIAARHLLDEGESIGAARGWRRVQVVLLQEKVRLCLLDGRQAEAGACASRLEALAAAARSRLDRVDFGRAATLARAWCDLQGGAQALAADALAPLLADARAEGRLVDAIGLLGALGLARQAVGDTAGAARALREACALAQGTGAWRALLDQPAPLGPLLQAAQRARAELSAHPWFEAALGRLQRAQGDSGTPRPSATPMDSLSPREQHILRLMADGQSNKEIARGLGIAPETVKTHVSKIFTKLGAQNRAQAASMVGSA